MVLVGFVFLNSYHSGVVEFTVGFRRVRIPQLLPFRVVQFTLGFSRVRIPQLFSFLGCLFSTMGFASFFSLLNIVCLSFCDLRPLNTPFLSTTTYYNRQHDLVNRCGVYVSHVLISRKLQSIFKTNRDQRLVISFWLFV